MAIALDWHEKTPQTAWSEGLQRSARDSNPQALSGARFRGECITILPALRGTELEASRLRVQECLWLPGSAQRASCGVGQPINRGAWGSFMTINRGARIRTGDLCDPNAALYRTEPHPGLLGYLRSGRGGIELRSFRDPCSSPLRSESSPRCSPLRRLRGFERAGGDDHLSPDLHPAYFSGRGGIRTHADNVHTISNRAP